MRLSRTLMFTVFLTLLFNTVYSFGAEFCVDNAPDLKTALSTAQSNGESDVIRVVQGNYNGNFSYNSSQGYSITLLGGYTAGCAGRVVDPANSLLDGGGTGRVLSLSNNGGGDFLVDGFTLQNGQYSGDGGGVYAESSSDSGTAGDVTFTNNIFRMNTSEQGGGGVYARSYSNNGTAGNVILLNNVITGNSADVGGGVFASSYTVLGAPGKVTFTNNTVTANSATDYGGGALLYSVSGTISGGILNCYNNILWGNTGPEGADLDAYNYANSTNNGYNNDYSVMSGTWDNGAGTNIDADPLLTGDYHLQSGSPCIDRGKNAAPGLPATDFEGQDRMTDGDGNGIATVDMGADEHPAVPPAEGAFYLIPSKTKGSAVIYLQ